MRTGVLRRMRTALVSGAGGMKLRWSRVLLAGGCGGGRRSERGDREGRDQDSDELGRRKPNCSQISPQPVYRLLKKDALPVFRFAKCQIPVNSRI